MATSQAENKGPSSGNALSLSSRSYWTEANIVFQKQNPELHDKLYQSIKQDGASSEPLETHIRKVLSDHIQTITDRQWCLKWGSRRVKLRSFLDRTVRAFERFKEVGSTAASIDPLHAGLPWAGICLLLPLVLNLSSQEDAAKSGVDEIAVMLSSCAVMERVHTRNEANDWTADLDEALVNLYVAILEYEAVALCFFHKRTLKRFLRSVPKFDDFQGLLEIVKAKEVQMSNLFNALSKYNDQKSLHDLQFTANEILEKIDKKQDKRIDILTWLSNIKYGHDHERAQLKLGSRYLDTGRWLLDSNQYMNWNERLRDGERVFWLHGHVGTGKTSLVSIIVQEHLRTLDPSSKARLAYFYCSKKEQQSVSPLDVLRSILSQLSWDSTGTSLADPIKRMYERADLVSGGGRPNIETCQDLLGTLVAPMTRVTVIVDAVDECSEPEQLLHSLHAIFTQAPDSARLFISSRMHTRVQDFFPHCLKLNPNENQNDITNFIRTEIEVHHERFLKGQRKDLEQRLFNVLRARTENVFRWAELQLSLFLSPKSRLIHAKDVELRLDALESSIGQGLPDLNEAYKEVYEMNTPQPHIRLLSQRVLRWLMVPNFPINDEHAARDAQKMSKVDATVDAVSLNADGTRDNTITREFILDICSNLILLDESSYSFRFAHLSVVEYLSTRMFSRNGKSQSEYSPSEITAQASLSCLSYLKQSALRTTKPPTLRRPTVRRWTASPDWRLGSQSTIPTLTSSLGVFAIFHWPFYYRAYLKNCNDSSARVDDLDSLFRDVMMSPKPPRRPFEAAFECWIDSYHKFQNSSLNIVRQDSHYSLGGTRTHPDAKDFYAKGIPSRAFVAAAFGFEEVYRFLPAAEIVGENDQGKSIYVVAREGRPLGLSEEVLCSRSDTTRLGLSV